MEPKHLTQLRLYDACHGLSVTDIETICDRAEVVQMDEGEVVHAIGEKLDAIYVVIEGRLKMMARLPDGTQRVLRYVAAGDQFGALMLVTDKELPVDVLVDEPVTLLRIQKEFAEQLSEQFPRFRRNLLRKVGFGVWDSLMGARRKRSVSKIVLFVHVDDRARQMVSDIATRLTLSGEKIGIISDNEVASPPGTPFKSLRDPSGGFLDAADVRETVEQWPELNRVFFVIAHELHYELLQRMLALTDKVFFVSGTENFQPLVDGVQQLIKLTPSWKKKSHFVWILGEDEPVAPLVPDLSESVVRDFKVQIPKNRSVTPQFTQGIDRMVHYLRDVSIGIALSGGAAHGMAHLGVLKALDEAGITIDKMAGTSAGVLTGVLYCAGYSPQWGIEQFTHDLEPGSIYNWLPKGDGLYLLEKYRSRSWDKMLRKYVSDWRLEQLPIPVNTITTDLVAAKSVTRTTGDAVDSILESINLPVLSPPICRDGMLLIDGGILNNLPADVLVNQGCNFVIAVDVTANIEHRVGFNTSETPTDEMKAPGAMTTLLRSLTVQAHNMSAVGAAPADVLIAPDVSEIDSTAFTKTPEMAEIGYQTTLKSLPRIREILHNLDESLFVS